MGRKRINKVEIRLSDDQKNAIERRYGSLEEFGEYVLEREFENWEPVTVIRTKAKKESIRLEDF